MNEVIRKIQRTGKVLDADGREYDAFPVSMSRAEGRVIYEMLRTIKASQTLEVGFAYAMSTLHICEAIRDREEARHIVIDPFQSSQWHNIGKLNLERAGLWSLVDFYEAPSDEVLPRLCQQNRRADFALIDGAHLFDYAFVDFFYVDKLLQPEGVVCMDDLWMPAIQQVARFFVRNRGYEILQGKIPSPVGSKMREGIKRLLGPGTIAVVRRALGRTRAGNRPTSPLLFLRKPLRESEPNWRQEHLVDF